MLIEQISDACKIANLFVAISLPVDLVILQSIEGTSLQKRERALELEIQ
jgi:hypothetical protein